MTRRVGLGGAWVGTGTAGVFLLDDPPLDRCLWLRSSSLLCIARSRSHHKHGDVGPEVKIMRTFMISLFVRQNTGTTSARVTRDIQHCTRCRYEEGIDSDDPSDSNTSEAAPQLGSIFT